MSIGMKRKVKSPRGGKTPNGGLKALKGKSSGRRLVKIAVCVSIWSFLSLVLYGAAIEVNSLEVRHERIRLSGGDDSIKLRLAVISDLHAMSGGSEAFLGRVVDEINRIAPDYTIIACDLVDTNEGQVKFLAPLLRLGRNRTIVILGNHDYGYDWAHDDAADRIAGWVEENGFVLLRNSNIKFSSNGENFCVIGADSLWGGNTDLEKAYRGVGGDCVRILIVHEPDAALEPGGRNANLILAGHTHGGQFCIPFIGPFKNSKAIDDDCIAGWYEVGGVPMYVTRGVGQSLPIRFNARPEITVMDIT